MSDGTPLSRSGRGTKRKNEAAAAAAAKEAARDGDKGEGGKETQAGKKSKGELYTPYLGLTQYPKEHLFNTDSYRYMLAEVDPHAPLRQEFDESQDMAGKPIPGFLCRVATPQVVLVAMHDRAQQIQVNEDRLGLTGYKFYCSARANHFVNRGSWYYEVKITELQDGAATRIGWAQKFANLQAPLGFDSFGYSVRSRKGTRFHEAIGKHYFEGGYGEGDVLGCLIVLPEEEGRDYLPPCYKDKPLIKYKSHFYYEEKNRIKEATKALTKVKGSKMVFFKNGESMGEAFIDLFSGDYYPSLSGYKSPKVKINFGPKFRHPPKGTAYKQYKPMCARADQAAIEQSLADMRFFTEREGKLRLDDYFMSP